MEQHDVHIFESGGLNERSRAYLIETARWTKFLAIIGFILTALMVLGALIVMTMGSTLGALSGTGNGMLGGLAGVGLGMFYVIFAVLYIYPVVTLYKFSRNMKRGIHSNNTELITEAFRNQKNLYKFLGILTIIMIAFYLIAIVMVGVVGFMSNRY